MNNPNDIEQRVVDILFDKGIVTFSFDPPYVYTNGLKSPIYIDNRLLISYPEERSYVVNELVKLIREKVDLRDINYISSSLNYAAPFGVLIADSLSLPLILVREEHRPHGKKNKLEGLIPDGANVLIIEDHISTGAILVDNAKTVRENGGKANYAFAITDYGVNLAKKSLKENNIQEFVLANGLSIIKEAVKRKMLNAKEEKEVLEWFKDPVKWGTVRGYYENSN